MTAPHLPGVNVIWFLKQIFLRLSNFVSHQPRIYNLTKTPPSSLSLYYRESHLSVNGGGVKCLCPWWRHQMETFSALLAICARNSPVPGEFPTQRPVTRSFDDYFNLRPNKRLSKQSRGWWYIGIYIYVSNITKVSDQHVGRLIFLI